MSWIYDNKVSEIKYLYLRRLGEWEVEENVCIKIDMFSIYTCFKETDLNQDM